MAYVAGREGLDAERDARPIASIERRPPAEGVEEQPHRLAEEGAVARILLGRLKGAVQVAAVRLQLHVEAHRADVRLAPRAHDAGGVGEAGPVQAQVAERQALHQVPPVAADAGICGDAGQAGAVAPAGLAFGLVPAGQLDDAFCDLWRQGPIVLGHSCAAALLRAGGRAQCEQGCAGLIIKAESEYQG